MVGLLRARMPTVLRVDGFRFFFYSLDRFEPPHVHIEYGDKLAKYWLVPVELAESRRFRSHELTWVRAMVIANRTVLLEAWHEYFG
jgi:hypothetical protein